MAAKLTAKSLLELPGPAGDLHSVIHYDQDLPGFGLRVTRSGARSLILNYRARGIERRMTLDSLPANTSIEKARTTLSRARKAAEVIKSGAKYSGADPMADRHAQRQAATVGDLAQRYLDTHAVKKRSRDGDEAMVKRFVLPDLGNKRVADLAFDDIDRLHRKVTNGGTPIQANRLAALLSKMLALAIKWGMRSDNPARGIERNPEQRRQRYLLPDELVRLGEALAAHWRVSSANAVRLLLLTGARRGEVLGATWDEFDLQAGVWTKPSAHTKQKREHRVPLSAPARQLLAAMRATAEADAKKEKRAVPPHIFPGVADGKAQADLKRFWATICRRAGISGARLHDLRHTYASILASSGQTLPIIGQLLGHTNPGTTSRYTHLFDDPLRAATERAAAVIGGAANPGNVVPMRRK